MRADEKRPYYKPSPYPPRKISLDQLILVLFGVVFMMSVFIAAIVAVGR